MAATEKTMTHSEKRIIEALLFATKEPLPIKRLQEVLEQAGNGLSTKEVKKLLAELSEEYTQRENAFQIANLADGYIVRTHADYYPYVNQLFTKKRREKLSQAATETLAIVAYRQPVTKSQIEAIRGVDCSGVLQLLQDRLFIEVSGKLEAPGRPSLFATTREFLIHFGLQKIANLPAL
jgi:segregation and condensation protein B